MTASYPPNTYSRSHDQHKPHDQLDRSHEQHSQHSIGGDYQGYINQSLPVTQGSRSPVRMRPDHVATQAGGSPGGNSRNKYVREYQIARESNKQKPRQDFILKWGPDMDQPTVASAAGRHPSQQETSRFGPVPDRKSHKRSPADSFQAPSDLNLGFEAPYSGYSSHGMNGHYQNGGTPDLGYSSPQYGRPADRSYSQQNGYHPPSQHPPGTADFIINKKLEARKQLWHYNQTYEEDEGSGALVHRPLEVICFFLF